MDRIVMCCVICGHRLFVTESRYELQEIKCNKCGTLYNATGQTGFLTLSYRKKKKMDK